MRNITTEELKQYASIEQYNIFKNYYKTLTKHQKEIHLLMINKDVELRCGQKNNKSYYYITYPNNVVQRIRRDTAIKILQPEMKFTYRKAMN